METLALLCTLHADGPATLKRLRRAGCATLAELESYDPAALASILEVAPAVARRLGREARTLSQRLGVEVFEDREEGPGLLATSEPQAARSEGGLDRRDRAILGKVLDRWRETPEPVPEEPAEEPAPREPAAPPMLPAGCVDGLDIRLSRRLADCGITTLEELAQADALELARATCLPFAQMRRFQFLARDRVPMDAAPTLKSEVSEPPLQEPPIAMQATDASSPPPVAWPVTDPLTSGGGPREDDDSSEPRKFWEPDPRWGTIEEPEQLPPEAPLLPEPERARREGVSLEWEFEIPRPSESEQQSEPEAEAEERPLHQDDTAGPFA